MRDLADVAPQGDSSSVSTSSIAPPDVAPSSPASVDAPPLSTPMDIDATAVDATDASAVPVPSSDAPVAVDVDFECPLIREQLAALHLLSVESNTYVEEVPMTFRHAILLDALPLVLTVANFRQVAATLMRHLEAPPPDETDGAREARFLFLLSVRAERYRRLSLPKAHILNLLKPLADGSEASKERTPTWRITTTRRIMAIFSGAADALKDLRAALTEERNFLVWLEWLNEVWHTDNPTGDFDAILRFFLSVLAHQHTPSMPEVDAHERKQFEDGLDLVADEVWLREHELLHRQPWKGPGPRIAGIDPVDAVAIVARRAQRTREGLEWDEECVRPVVESPVIRSTKRHTMGVYVVLICRARNRGHRLSAADFELLEEILGVANAALASAFGEVDETEYGGRILELIALKPTGRTPFEPVGRRSEPESAAAMRSYAEANAMLNLFDACLPPDLEPLQQAIVEYVPPPLVLLRGLSMYLSALDRHEAILGWIATNPTSVYLADCIASAMLAFDFHRYIEEQDSYLPKHEDRENLLVWYLLRTLLYAPSVEPEMAGCSPPVFGWQEWLASVESDSDSPLEETLGEDDMSEDDEAALDASIRVSEIRSHVVTVHLARAGHFASSAAFDLLRPQIGALACFGGLTDVTRAILFDLLGKDVLRLPKSTSDLPPWQAQASETAFFVQLHDETAFECAADREVTLLEWALMYAEHGDLEKRSFLPDLITQLLADRAFLAWLERAVLSDPRGTTRELDCILRYLLHAMLFAPSRVHPSHARVEGRRMQLPPVFDAESLLGLAESTCREIDRRAAATTDDADRHARPTEEGATRTTREVEGEFNHIPRNGRMQPKRGRK
jgi:hypothetical protein